MNTRIRNKKRIKELENKVAQAEQNMAAMILEQAFIIKYVDGKFSELFEKNEAARGAFRDGIEEIKCIDAEMLKLNQESFEDLSNRFYDHMRLVHPGEHKSWFRRLKGGK